MGITIGLLLTIAGIILGIVIILLGVTILFFEWHFRSYTKKWEEWYKKESKKLK